VIGRRLWQNAVAEIEDERCSGSVGQNPIDRVI
jgi:hypothetical protein